MSSPELKPCPLCGSERCAKLGGKSRRVWCSDPNCPLWRCQMPHDAWQALPRGGAPAEIGEALDRLLTISIRQEWPSVEVSARKALAALPTLAAPSPGLTGEQREAILGVADVIEDAVRDAQDPNESPFPSTIRVGAAKKWAASLRALAASLGSEA